ncbi:MAG: hypothetical protein EVA90_05235, partial [SAR116 cluster bacterium]
MTSVSTSDSSSLVGSRHGQTMAQDRIRSLHQKLWSVTDILRGRMDADEYRDYILGFI